ncbi:MAG TPA: hypothetical protein VFD67_05465, partial [Gemmatimonadaceae bacterium]|nr:hypothetical protein [Gemmatimonadaceae bacterium]
MQRRDGRRAGGVFLENPSNRRQCVRAGTKDARPARRCYASNNTSVGDREMNKKQTQVLPWARRVRDFLVEHDL